MDDKKKILLVPAYQFGYHSGNMFYAKYLTKYYDVTVLDYYVGKKIVTIEGVNVISVHYKSRYKSQFELIMTLKKLYKVNNYDFIFISYFLSCSLINLFIPRRVTSIDIRTSFIFKNKPIKEWFYNTIMKAEYRTFKNRTIISQSLGEFLKIKKTFTVIPLGGEAPKVEIPVREFSKIGLLYIGTFYDRNIEETIKGFKLFLDTYEGKIDIKYTLVGFGPVNDINKVKNEIDTLKLGHVVEFIGEVRYPENVKFFLENNIGVSFIPNYSYYDCQPPTKTFEYLSYGMPVIATNTKENILVINHQNGVLIDATKESFCKGINEILKKKDDYNSLLISNSAKKYTWEYIVNNYLVQYIEKTTIKQI